MTDKVISIMSLRVLEVIPSLPLKFSTTELTDAVLKIYPKKDANYVRNYMTHQNRLGWIRVVERCLPPYPNIWELTNDGRFVLEEVQRVPDLIDRRWDGQGRGGPRVPKNKKAMRVIRTCLRCQEPFASAHKFNRMCSGCAEFAANNEGAFA